MQPLSAIILFKDNFFAIEDPGLQYEIFQYIKQKPRHEYLSFYKKVQAALLHTPERLAIQKHSDIKQDVERLIHKSLLGEGLTRPFQADA